MSHPLTGRQMEFLAFIHGYVLRHGWAPSVRELMAPLRVHSTNGVTDHLAALARKGMISRGTGARAIRVTDDGRRAVLGAAVADGRWEDPAEGPARYETEGGAIEYDRGGADRGPRWRYGGGPWWPLAAGVGRDELPGALQALRRFGVVA